MMIRATLEAALTNKKAKGKDLHNKIEDVKARFAPGLIEVAKSQKLLGNVAAHESQSAIEVGEVEALFELLTEMPVELYERPLRIDAIKEALEAKEDQSEE